MPRNMDQPAKRHNRPPRDKPCAAATHKRTRKTWESGKRFANGSRVLSLPFDTRKATRMKAELLGTSELVLQQTLDPSPQEARASRRFVKRRPPPRTVRRERTAHELEGNDPEGKIIFQSSGTSKKISLIRRR